MLNCSQFCKGPINTNFGMKAKITDNKLFKGIVTDKDGNSDCPIGYTCNPNTEIAFNNVINNNGTNTICPRNSFIRQLINIKYKFPKVKKQ